MAGDDAEWGDEGRGSWLWLVVMVLAFWSAVLAGGFHLGRVADLW